MKNYEAISKKIDSFDNPLERYEYCKKVIKRIEKDRKKEQRLLLTHTATGNMLEEAIEKGEIQYNEEIANKRMALWDKCYDIVYEFERMRRLNCRHLYK